MVITSSDSTNTLVSLDGHNDLKGLSSVRVFPSNVNASIEFRRTALQLPEEEFDYFSDDEDDEDNSFSCAKSVLYLPKNGISVDESLKCVPAVIDARDDFLSPEPVYYDATSKQRLLYVAQGEIAHCTATQSADIDILVSDKATTCHILAFRSTSSTAAPLCSMTHLDDCSYTHCIRTAVEAHHKHHSGASSLDFDANIRLDIHVVGGFEDADGSSRKISSWLLHLLADLADDYSEKSMVFTLRTVCVTSMNDCNNSVPIARGLALNCRTGQVTTAKCSTSVIPALSLRSARLWIRNSESKLHLIHTQHDSGHTITVQPFHFKPFEGLEMLLTLSDSVLLQYCSTSPDCEEDDFVPQLRQTLCFLRDTSCTATFGPNCDRPLRYHHTRAKAVSQF